MRRCGYVRSDTEDRNSNAFGEADVMLTAGARMDWLLVEDRMAVNKETDVDTLVGPFCVPL